MATCDEMSRQKAAEIAGGPGDENRHRFSFREFFQQLDLAGVVKVVSGDA
jgi:hypothetical protein